MLVYAPLIGGAGEGTEGEECRGRERSTKIANDLSPLLPRPFDPSLPSPVYLRDEFRERKARIALAQGSSERGARHRDCSADKTNPYWTYNWTRN